MKTNSIKLVTLVCKKLMLQKKILKYNEMLKDVEELLESDINNKSNFEDFELIFRKLVNDFHNVLDNDEEDENEKSKMEIVAYNT